MLVGEEEDEEWNIKLDGIKMEQVFIFGCYNRQGNIVNF